MQHEIYEGDPIAKLRELLKDIKFAMLTTSGGNDKLVTRPMTTRDVEFDGDVWFFTDDRTGKILDIERNPNVNLAYFGDKNVQVSLSGRASVVRDRAKIDALWSPADNAYFEDKDDPHIVLLKVEVESAEFWESPGNFITRSINFVRAMATHDPSKLGDNVKLDLGGGRRH